MIQAIQERTLARIIRGRTQRLVVLALVLALVLHTPAGPLAPHDFSVLKSSSVMSRAGDITPRRRGAFATASVYRTRAAVTGSPLCAISVS